MSLRYIDLSKINFLTGERTKRNTANCYVIKKPGKYKFPIVYGNSIKNGKDNKESYLGFLEQVHGSVMNRPEIIYDNYSKFSLGIIQKSPSISIKAKIGPLYKYIKIKINTTNREAFGNALVGLYYTHYCVWCWNIWYCPEELSIIKIGYNKKKKIPERYEKFMAILSVPLGFCDENHYNRYVYGSPFPLRFGPKIHEKTWTIGENKCVTPFHKKLITDPCPPGFKIPGKDLFLSLKKKLKKESCVVILTDSGFKFITDKTQDDYQYLKVWSCNCPPQCFDINNKDTLPCVGTYCPIIPCVDE